MTQIPEQLAGRMGPDRPPVGWPWRLFLFSILVLAAAVVVYLGLDFGYKTYLNAQINSKDDAIAELAKAVSPEENKQFVGFYSQLANLQTLLDEHVFVSRLLPLLENNTNRLVYYDSVSFTLKDKRLVLGGVAASYEILAQQLEALNRAPEIERVLINESRRDGGRVLFQVSLFLEPTLFGANNNEL